MQNFTMMNFYNGEFDNYYDNLFTKKHKMKKNDRNFGLRFPSPDPPSPNDALTTLVSLATAPKSLRPLGRICGVYNGI